nr:SpaA isopeptide-forming pilin-related protein [Fimbriiglobus sp.]
MPTERDDVLLPKLEVVRLEDRLTPVAALTTDALLSFAPNPSLDFGTTMPVVPTGGVSTTTSTATTATSPLLAPNQYQLVLPATGDATTADSSGGSFALFSVVPPPPSANLSGFVYVDEGANGGVRDDGIKQPGEPGIPGATLTLLRIINGVTLTAGSTTTDANGFYEFTSLSPLGEYRVVETQPALFADGKDTAGTVNGTTRGTAGNDIISGIILNAGENGVNYNFGELSPSVPPAPARLSGFVYVDEGANGGTRDDGIKQAGEPGIPGTTITLFRVLSGVTTSVSQTTTDANGFYDFGQLQPGTYEVRQTQPAGFNDGLDTPGSTGGTAPQNDRLISIPLAAGQNSQNNNFGELFERGALSGFVYVDEGANGGTRDDGIRQPGETPIPGTTVTLFRVVNGQTTSVSQTTTDANGFYRFANLPAGGGYIVRETQPAGFNDGKDTPGSTGGTNSANDELSSITVPANGESQNNNFGELAVPPQPGALSGFVYVDEGANGGVRDDGQKQGGEPGIQGTTVTLFRVVNGVTSSVSQTTTDANGFYQFTGLTPGGGYIVRETQPAGFNDGKDTPGSTGGANSANDELSGITVPVNGASINNNFGELRQTGALSGFVYVDEGANGGTRDDGIRQPGETPIPGTTVTLFRVVNG